MADEWGTVGWTAQKPPTAFDNSGIVPWKIPGDVDIVTVTSQTQSASGGRARGFLQFQPLVDYLIHEPTNTRMQAPKWSASIGQDGIATLSIPASDATVLSPTPFQYEVSLIVNYRLVERFACTLNKDTPQVNLLDLQPDAPVNIAYYDGGSA
jgi:hypothetical protein